MACCGGRNTWSCGSCGLLLGGVVVARGCRVGLADVLIGTEKEKNGACELSTEIDSKGPNR